MSFKTVKLESKFNDKFTVITKTGNHTIYVDQPKEDGGDDTGPTPLQYFLISLSGCIATIARIVANQKKISLKGMTIKTEGDIDTDVLLGKNKEKRAGFTNIRISINVDSPMTKQEKEKFIEEVEKRCPISDNVANSTPFSIEIV